MCFSVGELNHLHDFVQANDFHGRESNVFQYVEMAVFSDDEPGVGHHCAIYEFVIVRVGGDDVETVKGRGEVGVRVVDNDVEGKIRKLRAGFASKYLGVFVEDFRGDAQGVAPVEE